MQQNRVDQLIGNTPMVTLQHVKPEKGAQIFVKLEWFNPGGSVKDRIAKSMIEALEKEGRINSESVLVEPTSGNTGIGLAMVAASKGYRLTLVMPDTMSVERRKILEAHGADLILTDGTLGMKGAIHEANRILEQNPAAILVGQFDNPANPQIHYQTTGPEIWHDLEGKVDAMVTGVGTGGTFTGAGKFLKEKNPNLHLVAVEPAESPVLSGGEPGPHKIQGIGAGFIPKVFEMHLMDQVITVSAEQAASTARRLAREEGLLLGYSSGAAIAAALQVAEKMNAQQRIVVISASNGERYLSSTLFE